MSDTEFFTPDKEPFLETKSRAFEDQLNGNESSDEHQFDIIDSPKNEIFETRFTFDVGRYLVAKTSFLPDEDVFVESPLILSPSSRNLEELNSTSCSANFLCFGCNKVIDRHGCLCCARCRWFGCSEECMREPWHTNFECSLFFKQDIIPSIEALKYVYLVRSLLMRERNEATWKKILNLRSVIDFKDEKFVAQLKKDVDESLFFLNSKCKIEVDKILLHKLIRIFAINAFRLNHPDQVGNLYNGWALFSTSCLLCHNCSPNLKWNFLPLNGDVEDRWRLILSACKPVKAGEIVSIPYDNFYSLGTLERRQELADSFHFLCKCPRCIDSSELGTNFSGIVCFRCKEVMLPEDPLNFNTDWKCTKCPARLAKFLVEKLQNTFSCDVKMILENTNRPKSLVQLDSLIHQCESKYLLYRNHSEVIRATMHWFFWIDLSFHLRPSHRIDEIYETLIERAKKCAQVASTIGTLYDLVLCEDIIAKSIIMYRFKSSTCLSTDDYDYTKKEKMTIFKRVLKHLSRGLNVIQKNVHNPYLFQRLQPMLQVYNLYREELRKAHRLVDAPDDYINPNSPNLDYPDTSNSQKSISTSLVESSKISKTFE